MEEKRISAFLVLPLQHSRHNLRRLLGFEPSPFLFQKNEVTDSSVPLMGPNGIEPPTFAV